MNRTAADSADVTGFVNLLTPTVPLAVFTCSFGCIPSSPHCPTGHATASNGVHCGYNGGGKLGQTPCHGRLHVDLVSPPRSRSAAAAGRSPDTQSHWGRPAPLGTRPHPPHSTPTCAARKGNTDRLLLFDHLSRVCIPGLLQDISRM